MEEKEKILISFSGGRTSAYMAYWMLNQWPERSRYDMIVVFANTGKEREETLQFVHQCDKVFGLNVIWVEAVMLQHGATFKIVDFETASRCGEPFESVIAKHGIPNVSFPHCSRDLKAVPISNYLKSIGWKTGRYFKALGIRSDEPKRLNWERAGREKIMYPLALENPSSRFDIAYFWNRQPFDLRLKSYEGNCDLCWKKSRRKLLTILSENEDAANWWCEMEQKYENFIPPSRSNSQRMRPPIRFYRGSEKISDLIEETLFPFAKAIDESKDETRLLLMRNWDVYLDGDSGCSESCEAF